MSQQQLRCRIIPFVGGVRKSGEIWGTLHNSRAGERIEYNVPGIPKQFGR